MKYLVVSADPRIPGPVLEGGDYLHMTGEEFVDAANSETGLNIEDDSVIYYNIDSITKELYDALKAFPVTIKYYLFGDQTVNLNFKIEENVIRYRVRTEEETEKPKVDAQQEVKEQEVKTQEVSKDDLIGRDILDTHTVEADKRAAENVWGDLLKTSGKTTDAKISSNPAKVYLFGSSKGGTGKTFTCLLSAYRYAKTHPNERIALADFDIIDGQVGIALWLDNMAPTLYNYYELYKVGRKSFNDLYSCHAISNKLGPNLDIYLAPPFDFPEVTNNNEFWFNVYLHLLENYDTVFFDSGIDYLGKPPISKLYKVADKVLITSNTSINSVKSIIKQLENLGGIQKNNVFSIEDKILERTHVIFTRVSNNAQINKEVSKQISKYVNIIASFGNFDDQIARTQWYQRWEDWDNYAKVIEYLDRILA